MRRLLLGDCRALLAEEPVESVHACLTDPPYDLTTAGRWGDAKTPPQEGTDGAFRRLSGGFMGMRWDSTSVAFQPETWRAVFRVLKPGAFLLAFGSPRTSHRMACAIEDAGFECRDSFAWVYGSGFPKSHAVGKAIDRMKGAEREVVGVGKGTGKQNPAWNGTAAGRKENSLRPEYSLTAPATPEAAEWEGWGTALKPAYEPVLCFRKPLSGTVAENVLRHGCGGLNIEAARLGTPDGSPVWDYPNGAGGHAFKFNDVPNQHGPKKGPSGRYPSNLLLSHAEGCGETACDPSCPVGLLDASAGERTSNSGTGFRRGSAENWSGGWGGGEAAGFYGDTGPASRFFATFPYESPLLYFPKPTRRERDAGCEALPERTRNRVNPGGLEDEPRWAPAQVKNIHPCCKPVNLLRYLARLICPPGGVVLDPFAGSGSTGVACALEGFGFLGMEQEPEYLSIAEARCAHAARQAERGKPLLAKTRSLKKSTPEQGDLFGDPQP